MNPELIEKLRKLKRKYEPEGFIVVGVFGSFARGDETAQSDVDVLYACTESILRKYRGWEFFSYYVNVKKDFEQELGRNVDLADENALSRIGRKYILPELVYVS